LKYQLYKEQQLNCDTGTAWEFFSSPYNLSKITPEDMGFTVTSDLGDESIFNYRYQFLEKKFNKNNQ